MDRIFTYLIDLPCQISEIVTPCGDGYTVYINSRLSASAQRKGYLHALHHIQNHDFDKLDVQSIEYEAHHEENGLLY